jgi:hypothetical protein
MVVFEEAAACYTKRYDIQRSTIKIERPLVQQHQKGEFQLEWVTNSLTLTPILVV